MKKQYFAPMSASIKIDSIVMATFSPAAPLTPGGEGGLIPAM